MPDLLPSATKIRRRFIVLSVIDILFYGMISIAMVNAMIEITGLFSILAFLFCVRSTMLVCTHIDRLFHLDDDVNKEVANQKFLNQLTVQRP